MTKRFGSNTLDYIAFAAVRRLAGIGLAFAACAAPAYANVATVPSAFPVALTCTIETDASAAGTAAYTTTFGVSYKSTVSRRITMLLVRFTLTGAGPPATREFLDSGGIPALGTSTASWRLSQIAPFQTASCTIAEVKYQ